MRRTVVTLALVAFSPLGAQQALAKGGFNTEGQYGLRVNHGLNVHIANFGVQK